LSLPQVIKIHNYQDVQYGDIDIMDRRLDFTVNPTDFAELNDYVKELKTLGVKFVTILV
jgi:alpha-glucosidase (family GH31 glycosyl hydrolase)